MLGSYAPRNTLSTLRRWDYSAAITSCLASFRIGTKQTTRETAREPSIYYVQSEAFFVYLSLSYSTLCWVLPICPWLRNVCNVTSQWCHLVGDENLKNPTTYYYHVEHSLKQVSNPETDAPFFVRLKLQHWYFCPKTEPSTFPLRWRASRSCWRNLDTRSWTRRTTWWRRVNSFSRSWNIWTSQKKKSKKVKVTTITVHFLFSILFQPPFTVWNGV